MSIQVWAVTQIDAAIMSYGTSAKAHQIIVGILADFAAVADSDELAAITDHAEAVFFH